MTEEITSNDYNISETFNNIFWKHSSKFQNNSQRKLGN